MVRKRTRKYDSDDNDSDSDVDFDFEHQSRPAPKKYSLRERKKAPLLADDFDYYGLDEEDGETRKRSSDDEDFEVEPDTNGARSYSEPEGDDPQNSEGLIDFEDIIRADIVVNKNKIDYDNLIQKTEIKLTQPKRRGRKPKIRGDDVKKEESESNGSSQLEHLIPLEKLQADEEVKEESNINDEMKVPVEVEMNKEVQESLPNGDVINNVENGDSKEDRDSLKNTSIDTVLLIPQKQDFITEQKTEEQNKLEDDDDDDVIVLGELKHDVIVLDD